jgi:Protein of unknown function (DUF2442).
MELVRIRSVKPLHDFVVYVEFTDKTSREINLEPYLRGEIFESIRKNSDIFRTVRVDPRMKTLCWANGADIDPDTLYHNLTPAWVEESEFELTK